MTEALWRTQEFLAAIDGSLIGAAPVAVTGISIDSRTIRPGEAFFAIRGDRFDGHDFVGVALAAGASVAIVARQCVAAIERGGGSLIAVDDPLVALSGLAAAARARSPAKIVAVTGSVGKTGTKEMLRLAFSALGETHASIASFNNHWGVPLSLARLPRRARTAIFEIGMNAPGEITPLARLVRPHAAIVTTVEAAHLEAFRDLADIAGAKAEIFSGVEPGGVAIVNRDNEQAELLAARARACGARVVFFGRGDGAQVRLRKSVTGADCSCNTALVNGREVAYKIGAPGEHLVDNSLAVLAAVDAFGDDLALAALALAEFHAPQGRGARLALRAGDGAITLIDESYNANPASMRAAIALLRDAETGRGGRRIAVLGDMLELGVRGEELHRALAEPLRLAGVDRVYLVGELMKCLWQDLPADIRGAHSDVSADLASCLVDGVRAGDVIMIKGSLGSRMKVLVDALRARYPVRGGAGKAA